MPRKTVSEFSQHVVMEIERLREEAGVTVRQLSELTGMGYNTYFVKLRGESAFTTEDIDKITRALGESPMALLRKAAHDLSGPRPSDKDTVETPTGQRHEHDSNGRKSDGRSQKSQPRRPDNAHSRRGDNHTRLASQRSQGADITAPQERS